MSSQKQTYTIPKKQRPAFLNAIASKVFPLIASKAKARKAINTGELLVNGKQVHADWKVVGGDEISFLPNSTRASVKPQAQKVWEEPIEVVFEDEFMAVMNKPGGIPVNGPQLKTLENALPHNLQPTQELDALPIFRPVHRLDNPTCGLVVVAKTERAQVVLGQQFQNKTIRKRYKAVVIGKLAREKGVIESPIDGKPSTTEYELVLSSKSNTYGNLSLVALYPVTGRTHQLRIHMSQLGHPVIGDRQYTKEHEVLQGKGLMLCSDRLSFKHPIHEERIELEIKIPNKFRKYMERDSFVKEKKKSSPFKKRR